MNAKETIEAGKLMVEYGEEWERTGKIPKWCEYHEHTEEWGPVIGVPVWSWESGKYRRRPEPKLVPFTADDITPGMQFRLKDIKEWAWFLPYAATVDGVWFKESKVTFVQLLQDYECLGVGETEWRPCGKVVES